MVLMVSIPLRAALAAPQEPLQRDIVALDPNVLPFSVDMPDAVEMWVISVIDLADDAPIAVGFVGSDRDRPMQPNAFNHLAHEGLGSFSVPPTRI